MLQGDLQNKILRIQKNEATEQLIYERLAGIVKIKDQADILRRIAADEAAHYDFFRSLTQADIVPDRLKAGFYIFISRFFGLNFGLKLMENGETIAQDVYEQLKAISPRFEAVIGDEKKHETELISLIDEERLKYVSSIVLGLNDALVELTGALAGFTLAIQNPRLISVVGLITGIAASMSMASAEYLSTKHESGGKSPLKASVYTGIAYVCTVLLLIVPYLIFSNIFLCLGLALVSAMTVILAFTFYISVAKGLNFRKRFIEMAGLSLTIAAINFCIGLLIRKVFGVAV